MKNIKITLISFIFFVLNSIILAQSKYNLSFDNFNSENQDMPDGWFKWGNFKMVTGEKLGDNNYVGKVMSDTEGKFGCITYQIPANYVGDTITLIGRMKYEKVKNYVGLLMRIDGENKTKPLAFKSMQQQKIKGTNDWKEYSIKLPYPTGAATIFVGGILGGSGTAWFDDFKIYIDGKDIQYMKETPKSILENYDEEKLNSAIIQSSLPINVSSNDSLFASLDLLISKLGDEQIIAIGESTHGTSEYYLLREMITQRLIQEKGYNMVVLESPYDDIELLNKNLSTKSLDNLIKDHLFSIYQTKEMKSFLQWYKDNRSEYKIQFKGCDDSYWVFYEVLSEYIGDNNDSKLDKLVKKLKSNLDKSSNTNLKNEHKSGIEIYNNIVSIENYLRSINKLSRKVEEILFNGKNTYVNYVNVKNNNQIQSRDVIMAERISYLAKDKKNKIIVWAHNAHISNEIIVDNEIGLMGRNLKKEFGNNYHSIGLTTLKGSYSYIDEKFINGDHNYKDELKSTFIEPTELLLWENAFAVNGNAFYLDLSAFKGELKTENVIGPIKLIGYGKESKENIYWIPIVKHFDSVIFVKNTSSTKSIFD